MIFSSCSHQSWWGFPWVQHISTSLVRIVQLWPTGLVSLFPPCWELLSADGMARSQKLSKWRTQGLQRLHQLSHVQNCRQLTFVFGGIYSLKNWMASHAQAFHKLRASSCTRKLRASPKSCIDTLKTNTWIYNKKGYTTWWARVSNVVQGISRKVRASFAQAKGFLPTICPTETRSNMIVDSPYLLLYAGQ